MDFNETEKGKLEEFLNQALEDNKLDDEDMGICKNVIWMALKSGESREVMKTKYLSRLKECLDANTESFIDGLFKEIDKIKDNSHKPGDDKQTESEKKPQNNDVDEEENRDFLFYSDVESDASDEFNPRRLDHKNSITEDSKSNTKKTEDMTRRPSQTKNPPSSSATKPPHESSGTKTYEGVPPPVGPPTHEPPRVGPPKMPPPRAGPPRAPPPVPPQWGYPPPAPIYVWGMPPPGYPGAPNFKPGEMPAYPMMPPYYPKPPAPGMEPNGGDKRSHNNNRPPRNEGKDGDDKRKAFVGNTGDATKSDAQAKNPNPEKNIIYLRNLPDTMKTMASLSKIFEKFGEITSMNLDEGDGMVSIKFKKPKSASYVVSKKPQFLVDKNVFITMNPNEKPPANAPAAATKQADPAAAKTVKRVPTGPQAGVEATKQPAHANQASTEMVDEKKGDESSNTDSNAAAKAQQEKLAKLKEKKELEESKKGVLAKFTNKLKTLLELKSMVDTEEKKAELQKVLLETKAKQNEVNKGTFDSTWKEFVESCKHEIENALDYTLIAKSLPEAMANNNALFAKFKGFGKIETIKMTSKNTAAIKFSGLKIAEKALTDTKDMDLTFADESLYRYLQKPDSMITTAPSMSVPTTTGAPQPGTAADL